MTDAMNHSVFFVFSSDAGDVIVREGDCLGDIPWPYGCGWWIEYQTADEAEAIEIAEDLEKGLLGGSPNTHVGEDFHADI